MLLKGTELKKKQEEYGLKEEVLSSVDLSMDLPKERMYEALPHVTSSPWFSREDWVAMKDLAQTL